MSKAANELRATTFSHTSTYIKEGGTRRELAQLTCRSPQKQATEDRSVSSQRNNGTGFSLTEHLVSLWGSWVRLQAVHNRLGGCWSGE